MSIARVKHTYIDRGSYGCVIEPSYPCSGKILFKNPKGSSGKFISKIFDDETTKESQSNMASELLEIKKILKIDPNSKFTVKMSFGCETDVDKNIIETCNRHRSDELKKPLYKGVSEIIMEYGGKAYQDITPVSIMVFMSAFQPIIEGLRTMSRHKYCHRDIKPCNLLYNSTKNKHVIIDFGLMKEFSKLYDAKEHYIFSYTYMYYPPEFLLITYFYDKPQIITLDDIIDDLKKNRSSIKKFIQSNISEDSPRLYSIYRKHFEDEADSFIDYVQTYMKKNKSNKSKQEILKKLGNDLNPSKIDIYSIGISLMEMYHVGKIVGSSPKFVDLFLKLSSVNPINRPNHAAIIRMIKSLLKK